MTKEEAINEIKSWDFLEGKEIEAIHTLIPELTESEDEKIRKVLLNLVSNDKVAGYTKFYDERGITCDDALAYLEKQKEQKTTPNWMPKFLDELRSKKNYFDWDEHRDIEGHILAIINWIAPDYFNVKEKEQKPILEVFGFKVGDAVRLKDGDGRKHIIESFEENEGLHGPNFYRVVFEDNAADYIFTGDKYPNGYYAQMEKFEEEQKPAEWSKEDDALLKEIVSFFKDGTVKLQHDLDLYAGFLENKFKSLRPQPKKELSIEKAIQWLDDTFYFLDNSSGRGRDCEITTHDFDSLEEMYDSFRKAVIVDSEPSWKPSEEQMEALNEIINTLAVSKHPHENDYLFNILNGLRKNLKTIPRDWVPVKEEHWKPSEEQMEAFSQIVQQFKPDKELESLYEDLQKKYGTS